MHYPAISTARAWALSRWAAVLILVAVAVGLVPPGSLPYPPAGDASDAALSHWPNADFLRQSLWHYGEWPLWNPLRMLGQPFAANPLTKVWYPPQWLVLLLPPALHLDVMLYLHMAWLAIGMVAWMRAERVRPSTAFFAAIAWGLNPKLIGHLGAGHLDIVYALAWIPWLLWASSRVADTPTLRWGALAGTIAAMLALADLRIAFYMLPVAAIYATASSLAKKTLLLKSWRVWGLAVVLLVLLTAIQTIPLMALNPYLTRASLTSREAAVYSLPVRYLLGLLIPDLSGFHEWMTYLGLPIVGLSVYALSQEKRKAMSRLWWGLAVLALLWALGENGPLFLLAAEYLPVAGWFRVPSRAWLVVALSLVSASVYGLEALLDRGLDRRGRLMILAAAFAGGVWGVSALALPKLPSVLAGVGAALFGTSVGMWLAGGGLADLAPFFDERARLRGRLAGIVVLVVTLAVSLLMVDATLVRARTLADSERPEQAIIAEMDDGCRSVFSPTFSLVGPAAAQARLVTLHGIDPFQLQRSAETIAAAAGTKLDAYSVIAPPLPPDDSNPASLELDIDLLQRLGVCWVISDPGISSDGMQISDQLDEVDVYRLPAGKPEAGITYIDIDLSTGNNRFRTQVCLDDHSEWGVVRQAWAPGWQVHADGKPIAITSWNGLLAVNLDQLSGCQALEIAYRPLADFIGMAVSGVTLLAMVVWAAVEAIHHRWKGLRRA